MTLNEWAAQKKTEIYEALKSGQLPDGCECDKAALKQALTKGAPQMGATKYDPDAVRLEYIFPDAKSSATVLTVGVDPPERIVYLPVPEWVIEDVWQGDVAGSFHFESHAKELLAKLHEELAPGRNDRWFGPQPAKRRE
ncbi:MAG: hypothetical protein H0W86_10770 [Armatimonadetes bacterium]|nr:hypothetical protein [Armatimonadota bacterium]